MVDKEIHDKVDSVLGEIQLKIDSTEGKVFESYILIYNEIVFVKECIINYKDLRGELKQRDFSFYELSKELDDSLSRETIENLSKIKTAIS